MPFTTPSRATYARAPRDPEAWSMDDDADLSIDLPIPDLHYKWLAEGAPTDPSGGKDKDSETDNEADSRRGSKDGLNHKPYTLPLSSSTSYSTTAASKVADVGVSTPGSDGPSRLLSITSHTPPVSNSSTISAASSYPTPPGSEYPSTSSRTGATASGLGIGHRPPPLSEVGEHGQILRGRIVSAPVGDDKHQPKTAEYRTTTTDNTTLGRRSFITPGLNQRTIAPSTASQASGRLSRFGGPARRGQFQAPDIAIEPELGAPKEEPELESQSILTPPREQASSSRYSPEHRDRPYSPEHRPERGYSSSEADRRHHRSPDIAYERQFNSPADRNAQSTPPDRFRERDREHESNYDRAHERERERERERTRASRHSPPSTSESPERRNSPPPLASSGRENRQVMSSERPMVPDPVAMPKRKVDIPHEREYDRPIEVARRPVPIPDPRPRHDEPHLPPRRDEPQPLPRHVSQPTPPISHRPAPAAPQSAAPAQPAPATLPTKRNIIVNGKPYERLSILGKGGSSKVYSVLCPTTRAVYAIKRVILERADAETYQSYTNEIELLRRLKGHDRIIQLIEHQITFTPANRPKILNMVMECGEIDFATLLEEQRGQPLNLNFVGLYWQQMLEAVHVVHAENVVHTDLKPANFVLVKGRLKIIDFGIAKAIANDTVNIHRDQQIGTVNYMSPEAILRMNNQKVLKLSYPSDIWSLGCILYQMIYGTTPFHYISGGPLPKMNAIADPNHRIEYPSAATSRPMPTADNPSPKSFTVPVPAAVIASIRGCLEYNKDRRLTIPQLLAHEFLQPSAAGSGTPSLPPGATSITKDQMAMLVNYLLRENGMKALGPHDHTAEELFEQLEAQNSRAQ